MEQITKAEIIDMDIYHFFELLAKASISDVLAIKGTLIAGKAEMLELANVYKEEMFNFTEETFDPTTFDEKFTRVLHCFALALYLDKKIEACEYREVDLTPDCFKKDTVH